MPGANRAPQAPQIAIGPASATTEDDLWIDVVEDAIDPDGDTLQWSLAWLRDGFLTLHEGPSVPAEATRRDEVWELRVVVSDGYLDAPEATALLVIANSPPVPTVRIEPPDPDTSSDLVATAEVTDADGDTVGLVYRWWRDGEATDWTERTLPAGATAAGEHWTVGVQALDDRGTGAEVVEGVTIANAAPRVREVGIEPDEALVTDSLTAWAEVEDLDEDPLELVYAWEFDGTVVHRSDLPGLPLPTPPRDTSVVVSVTADDGTATSNTMRSAAVVIGNSPPSFTGARLSPAAPAPVDTVLCIPEGWQDDDGDPEEADIDWELDGSWVASGASLVLVDHGVSGGETLLCRAIPEDAYTHGAPVEATAQVLP